MVQGGRPSEEDVEILPQPAQRLLLHCDGEIPPF